MRLIRLGNDNSGALLIVKNDWRATGHPPTLFFMNGFDHDFEIAILLKIFLWSNNYASGIDNTPTYPIASAEVIQATRCRSV